MTLSYTSWSDLFHKWTLGAPDIRPGRVAWQYKVEKDILVHKIEFVPGSVVREVGVGVPIGAAPPRLFAYLTNQWRSRIHVRKQLEDFGGIPILDFEMNPVLRDLGRSDLLYWVDDASDLACLEFLREWVLSRGTLSVGVYWRGCRVEPVGCTLHVARKPRGRALRSSQVAAFDHPGGDVLRLAGQVCRSPLMSWVKDALYCAVSRELGVGKLPATFRLERLGAAGCGATRVSGGVIDVSPTPAFVLNIWPFQSHGTPTYRK